MTDVIPDKYKNLFHYELLKGMLVKSKKANIENTEEEIYNIWNTWLMKHHDYRVLVSRLPEKHLNRYKELVEEFFNSTDKDTLFMFNDILYILIKYQDSEEYKSTGVLKEINNHLTPLSFKEFLLVDDKKEYYVKNMFAKGTINMIFSPPASMKSFVSYYLGLCLATGTEFLNNRTKKVAVGYFDWENPISDVKNRVLGICKGMNLDCSNIDNFYFYSKQPSLLSGNNYETFVIDELRIEILNFIKENNIKVLFFDTLRRLGNFDENDSKSINVIKSELFDYLIKETNICIIFLHHTSKAGENYRGSVDIEGILDTAYFVQKRKNEDILNLTIKNTKRRNNEIELLNCIVDIENQSLYDEDGDMYEQIISVKFDKSLEKEDSSNNATYKDYIKFLKEKLNIGEQYKNKEIVDLLSDQFQISKNTTQRVIDWVIENNIIQAFGEKGTKNRYYSINPSSITKDEELILKDIEKNLKNSFEDNDLVNIEVLKSKFDENYFNIILNKWIKKGWLNVAKQGYLTTTELYKAENEKIEFDVIEMGED